MKRPVWNYRVEATTTAPIDVVQAGLLGLASALPLSVCCPRLGKGDARGWVQTSATVPERAPGFLRLEWTAQAAGLVEAAAFTARATGSGCLLRAEGRLKGWPLLWKLPLLEWRSEGVIRRFVAGL